MMERFKAPRFLPTTSDKVSMHTPERVNQRILYDMETSISHYLDDRGGIATRLKDLEYEWDVERAVETSAAVSILAGLVLGSFVNRRWNWLAGAVGGLLLSHALRGWNPPVALLRRVGFRTSREIESERMALKALRGDFEGVVDQHEVSARDLLLSADPSFYH